MALSYILRVTQLDAVHLDEQVEELFKHQLFQSVKFLEPGILQPFLPELEFLLRSWVFKYSVFAKKCTFGQEMLSLKYKTDNFTKSKLYWFYAYTVILKYVKERAIYSLTTHRKVQNAVQIMENFQLFGDIINFLQFIQSGKYPVLIDLILGLELSAEKLTRENLNDFSWTRELLWHNFIELMGTTISLMNLFGLRSKMSNILKYVWWRKHIKAPSTVRPAIMTSNTVCAYCSNKPVLPHTMGCSHIFCYYCVMANKTADPNFTCPKCYFNGKEINKFTVT